MPCLTALAAVMVLVLPATSHATFPGKNGKLVFDRAFDDGTRLWTVDPDGTDLAELGGCWEGAGETDYQEMPTWSPDGAKVVYNCQGLLVAIGADGTGEQGSRMAGRSTPRCGRPPASRSGSATTT